MSLNILFSVLFMAVFTRVGWMPHGGLALANSLATALEMIVLLYVMRGRLDGLETRRVLLGVFQAAGATFVMSLVLVAWLNQTINQPVWLVIIAGVAIGAGVYGLIVLLLGVKEARALVNSASQFVRLRFFGGV
jgi:putative peptidoglycan lipid II flippase